MGARPSSGTKAGKQPGCPFRKEELMSEESFDQETEAKDEEDVESHGHKNLKNVEASDEPGNDESDDVEAHTRRNL